MKLLNDSVWVNIFRNIAEEVASGELNAYDDDWVFAVYLDPIDEDEPKFGLAYGEELFEYGFETEREALNRLQELEDKLLSEEVGR